MKAIVLASTFILTLASAASAHGPCYKVGQTVYLPDGFPVMIEAAHCTAEAHWYLAEEVPATDPPKRYSDGMLRRSRDP